MPWNPKTRTKPRPSGPGSLRNREVAIILGRQRVPYIDTPVPDVDVLEQETHSSLRELIYIAKLQLQRLGALKEGRQIEWLVGRSLGNGESGPPESEA